MEPSTLLQRLGGAKYAITELHLASACLVIALLRYCVTPSTWRFRPHVQIKHKLALNANVTVCVANQYRQCFSAPAAICDRQLCYE
jgi:hypothetical protein